MNALVSKIFIFWFTIACELQLASYGCKNTSWLLSDMSFCAYFKYNSNNKSCLQVYYIPNNTSTTKNALFYVKNSKAVATYKLWPIQTLLSYYFEHKYKWQHNSGCQWLYYSTVMIAFLPSLHLSEVQTEVQLMSCCSVAIAVSLHKCRLC